MQRSFVVVLLLQLATTITASAAVGDDDDDDDDDGVGIDARWTSKMQRYSQYKHRNQHQLDGCIVWNAHNTVFGSKSSAICAQAVHFLHSTRPSVTWLSSQ